MKKLLMIGNSFSEDASAKVEGMTSELFIRNLYIGGCSLERHASLLHSEELAYDYQKDGKLLEKTTLARALEKEEWDYITVQQASVFSGLIDSYYPYLTELLSFVRARSDAEILFHQTWAYEKDLGSEQFSRYDGSQKKMEEMILSTSKALQEKEGLRVIENGLLFQRLKESPLFDVTKGGTSVHRDGFHAGLDEGRSALAANLVAFFTGEIPDGLSENEEKNAYIRAAIARLYEE